MVCNADNSTTQFDNFTIEWQNFSLFSCVKNATVSVSLFTCRTARNYSIDEIGCLENTTVDFNDSVCQVTVSTTQGIYTTVPATTTGPATTMAIGTTAIQVRREGARDRFETSPFDERNT
jgi:nucleoside-triphosphatase THEP1